MSYTLKNSNLEIHIDGPEENYNFSRFDWTGKITNVTFQGIPVSTIERTDDVDLNKFGKAFYNEFGIDSALGFDEAEIGGWFHKIGVGLLKKNTTDYNFYEKHDIKPAKFEVDVKPNQIIIICKSEEMSGYSYVLKKTITLKESGFTIDYKLENTGGKDIITDEYVHNFTAINNELMGTDYVLKFPFELRPKSFNEIVNPEGKVEIYSNELTFKGSPNDQFFFSNLTGAKNEIAKWDLINKKLKIGISEEANFTTNKMNLWGWKHVISPEMFFRINLKLGESVDWSRTYRVYRLN